MNLGTSRLSIAPGNGFVARHGSVVLLVDPGDDQQDAVTDELLQLAAAPDGEALALVRQVGALVTQRAAGEVPSFGMLVEDGDDVIAVLSGQVSLTVSAGEGASVVHGQDATTYVERRLSGADGNFWLCATGSPDADPRSSLSSGVVRGAGVLLVPGPEGPSAGAVAPPTVEQPVDPAAGTQAGIPARGTGPGTEEAGPVAFEPISLFGEPAVEPAPETVPAATIPAVVPPAAGSTTTQAVTPQRSTADQLEPPAGADAVAGPEPTLVEGIHCSRGHFNSPKQIFCTGCGISMVQMTHNRVRGPRPPLGVLVTDDGSVYSLAHDYVVGREPETAPEVVSGAASSLVLDDPELAISRVHARVLLDGWEVRVEDAGSANGTYVAVDGDHWVRLEPKLPTTIAPGARIAVGDRVLSFETHQRA